MADEGSSPEVQPQTAIATPQILSDLATHTAVSSSSLASARTDSVESEGLGVLTAADALIASSSSSTAASSTSPAPVRPPPNAKTKPCKWWLKGYCARGDNCWFLHPRGGGHNAPSNPLRASATPFQPSISPLSEAEAVPPPATTTVSAVITPPDEAPPCSICFEIPASYGLLEQCDHPFCLSCIRSWRQDGERDASLIASGATKTCPTCRQRSNYIIPSSHFFITGAGKEATVQRYREILAAKPCKFFEESKNLATGPRCPFGDECHYRHTLTDGDDRYIFGKGRSQIREEAREDRLMRSWDFDALLSLSGPRLGFPRRRRAPRGRRPERHGNTYNTTALSFDFNPEDLLASRVSRRSTDAFADGERSDGLGDYLIDDDDYWFDIEEVSNDIAMEDWEMPNEDAELSLCITEFLTHATPDENISYRMADAVTIQSNAERGRETLESELMGGGPEYMAQARAVLQLVRHRNRALSRGSVNAARATSSEGRTEASVAQPGPLSSSARSERRRAQRRFQARLREQSGDWDCDLDYQDRNDGNEDQPSDHVLSATLSADRHHSPTFFDDDDYVDVFGEDAREN